MTDRHAGYVVTLEKDIREDDAQAIINAISMIKHVVSVKPVINDVGVMIAEERATRELGQKLWEVLYPRKN